MSTPTGSTPPQGPLQGHSWWLAFGSLIASCSLAAAIANDTGLSERFARAHPALPPLPLLVSLLVPATYLALRVGGTTVRRSVEAARRSPMISASIVALGLGTGLAAALSATTGPRSPARTPEAVSYYDILGDASILESHVTLPPGTVVSGGTTQYKIFRLRNVGTVAWVHRFLCRDDPEMNTSDNLSTPDCASIPNTAAGETVDVGVRVKVANRNGTLLATFKMSDGDSAWYFRTARAVRIELIARKR
jgi:hypothetical protein